MKRNSEEEREKNTFQKKGVYYDADIRTSKDQSKGDVQLIYRIHRRVELSTHCCHKNSESGGK